MMRTATVLLGGLLLAWPAALNRYPILFSDTGAFLSQTLDRFWAFDKPVAYGYFLQVFHGGVSLWGPALAQAGLLSWLLWLTQRVFFGPATTSRHVALCLVLAVGTAAPWVTVLLMPDIFAPLTVLTLALLGFGWDRLARWERVAVTLLAVLAVAVHLTHLPIAAAIVVLAMMVTWRWVAAGRVALPLLLTLGLLVACNWAGFGRPSVSPFGSVFLLARLVADGPAAAVIRAHCPAEGWSVRGWSVCGWVDRLPTDSDDFLWHPDGPLWALPDGSRRPGGAIAFAAEADVWVAATLREAPLAVLQAGLANGWRQLWRIRVGDALENRDLPGSVVLKLAQHFPAAEQTRFARSRQALGTLPALAEPFFIPHAAVLVLGTLGALLVGWRAALDGDRRRLGLVLAVGLGVLVNAGATGALSGPHDRYQARIAWLLPAIAVLGWSRRIPA